MDGNRYRNKNFLHSLILPTKSLFKIAVFFFALMASFSADCWSAALELSGMLSYSKTEIPDSEHYRSEQRRYTGTVGFKFTAVSELEFEYTYATTKTSYQTNIGINLPQYTTEAITSVDKIYSFNWVQNLVPSRWVAQPYFVIGGGKMFRTYTREYPAFGSDYTLSIQQNVVSGTGGLGLRIFLTRNLAIKAEMKTYVPKFQFSKWKQSQVQSVGLSWSF